MIRYILLIFIFQALAFVASAQITHETESIDNFEESLFLHVVQDGIISNFSLYESYASDKEKEISENLTEYPYRSDLSEEALATLKNKKLILDLASRQIRNKDFSRAQSILLHASSSDFDGEEKETYQFLKGYISFVHKDFRNAQLVFDHENASKSKYKFKNLYYSAFCDMFSGEYEAAFNKYDKLKNQSIYQNDLPYYMALMKYQLGQYDAVIRLLSNELDHSRSIYKDEMKELLSRAYYKESKWEKLSDVLLSDKDCCETPEQHYFVGMSLYKKGDLAIAENHLLQATKMRSQESQNALLAIGAIKAKRDVQNAIPYLKEAALMSYNDDLKDQALYALGKAYKQNGQQSLALSALGRITTNSKINEDATNEKLKILYDQGDYKKALVLIEESSNNPLLHQDILLRLGINSYESKDYAKAYKYLNQASLKDTDLMMSSRATHLLAKLAYAEKNDEKLASAINRYESINKSWQGGNVHTDSEIYYLKAYRDIENDKFSAAIASLNLAEESLKKAFRIKTQNHHESMYEDILLRKADCYFEMNLKREAAETYNLAYEHRVDHGDYALYQKGKIEDLNNEPYLQVSTYDLLEKNHPNSKYLVDSWIKRGEIMVELNKAKEAYDQFAKVYKSNISNNSQKYQALAKLGILTYNQGDVETALSFYEKVLEIEDLGNEQKEEAMLAIEEIYLNDLQDSESYYALIEGSNLNKASKINRDSIDFHLALESLHPEQDKGILALENYLNKYKSGSYREETLKELAKNYEINGNVDKAINTYTQLMDEAPRTKQMAQLRIIHNLGLTDTKVNEYVSTNILLLKENYSEKLNNMAYANLAKAATKVEDPTNYEKHISIALSRGLLSENEADVVRMALVKALLKGQRYEDSKKYLNALAASENDEIAAESIFLVARRLYQLGKFEEALAASNKALKRFSGSRTFVAEVILLQAEIYISQDELEAAKSAVETVLSQENLPVTLLRLGDNLLKQIKTSKKEKANIENTTLNLQYGTHE